MAKDKKNAISTTALFEEVHKMISSLMTRDVSEQAKEAILNQRAERLKQIVTTEDTGEKIDIVVFRLGSDFYAIEATDIHEIRPVSEITPVPCTPDFVLGITTVRGSIYSVVDIRQFVGADDEIVKEESMFIVVFWKDVEICVLVDEVFEKKSVPKRDIKSSMMVSKTASSNFSNGLVADGDRIITLINWEAFVDQSHIIVNEEV